MEREKLIEAAKLLKEYCSLNNCDNCPFWNRERVEEDCEIAFGQVPSFWCVPEVQDDEAVQDLMAFKERYKNGKSTAR